MKIKSFLIALVVAVFAMPVQLCAQQHTIYGSVYLGEGIPVKNVPLVAKNSGALAKTDTLGNFMIVTNAYDKILVKAKCFKKVSVKVSPADTVVDIKVSFPNVEAKVQQALGYGYINEADRSGALKTLSSNDFSRYSDIWVLIKEKFLVNSINNGCVIVRGLTSIHGESCAMFIVDGIETSSVDNILPSEISEISLLKDGSSAIYGARAANGVFIINTNKIPQSTK